MKDWIENVNDKRTSFPMDYRFHRTLFKFWGMSLIERIRVVQYPPQNNSLLIIDMVLDKRELEPHIVYTRFVGTNDRKMTSYLFKDQPSFFKLSFKFLTFLFNKESTIYSCDVKHSKYAKYPFIRKLFKDLTREDKLKQLGM